MSFSGQLSSAMICEHRNNGMTPKCQTNKYKWSWSIWSIWTIQLPLSNVLYLSVENRNAWHKRKITDRLPNKWFFLIESLISSALASKSVLSSPTLIESRLFLLDLLLPLSLSSSLLSTICSGRLNSNSCPFCSLASSASSSSSFSMAVRLSASAKLSTAMAKNTFNRISGANKNWVYIDYNVQWLQLHQAWLMDGQTKTSCHRKF